eukprot:5752702-Amphidinium_carterae.1
MQSTRRPNQSRPPARSGTRRRTRLRRGTPKPTDPVCRLARQSSASRPNHARPNQRGCQGREGATLLILASASHSITKEREHTGGPTNLDSKCRLE